MAQTGVSIKKQIKIYRGKCFRIFANEKGWLAFVSALIITLLVSFVAGDEMFLKYLDTKNGIFALICGCIWIGIFNSIQSICKERDIIKREYRAGLSMVAYIVAHFQFEAVLCAIEALIVTAVMYAIHMENIPQIGIVTFAGIELYITLFLSILTADALGLMVSSVVKTPNSAMTIMPFILIFQLIMAGVIFEMEEGASYIISLLTVCKWSQNTICSIVDVENMSGYYALSKTQYTHSLSTLLVNGGALLAFMVIYLLIAIVALKLVDKDKR